MRTSFIVIVYLLTVQVAFSQPATLNTAFGNNGKVLTNIAYDNNSFNSSATAQSDGKILMCGEIQLVNFPAFCVLRVFPTGIIDSSFGDNGKVVLTDMGYILSRSIAVQPDGKILVAANNDSVIICVRLKTNGSPDSSFNGNGRLYISNTGTKLYPYKIAVQQDGKLVIAGSAATAAGKDFFISRILTTGILDNTFNGNGKLVFPVCSNDDQAKSVSFQSNGKIVVTGDANFALNYVDFITLRLNVNGSVDNTFNNNTGSYIYSGPYDDRSNDIAVQTDDKILVQAWSNGHSIVLRLKPDGTIDNTFNGNGISDVMIGETSIGVNIFVRNTGKILVTGESYIANAQGWNYSAYQLNSAGTLDVGFNGSGKMYFQTTPETEHCVGSALLPDGKLVLTGFSNLHFLYTVSKVSTTGTLDNTFGTNGTIMEQISASDDAIDAFVIQSDNKILATGHKNGQLYRGIPMVRYFSNGSIDNSFGTKGKVIVPIPEFYPQSVYQNTDGKYLLAGTQYRSYPSVITARVVRVNINGTIDYTYNSTGNFDVPADSTNIELGASLHLPDGKLLITGRATYLSPTKFFVAKIKVNGGMDSSFGTNGKVAFNIDPFSDYPGTMALQSDGKIIISGFSYDAINDEEIIFVARLKTDGKMDSTFGLNGVKTIEAIPFEYNEANNVAIQPDGKIVISGNVFTLDSSYLCVIRLNQNSSFDSTFHGNGILYFPILNQESPVALALGQQGEIYLGGEVIDNTTFMDEMFVARVTAAGRLDSSFSQGLNGEMIFTVNAAYCGLNAMKLRSDGSLLIGGFSGDPAAYNSSDFALTSFIILNSGATELCPGGSTILSSNITGADYQWQVNTGNGYTPISDNTIYSGTHSTSLSLHTVPSSYYGYQYRCVVAGSNSNVFTLKFVNTWNGSVSTAWENPANWSCGNVPDINTDVRINSGSVILNSNTSIRSLKLAAGVIFTIGAGFNLTITH